MFSAEKSAFYDKIKVVAMDQAFKRAMLDARGRGEINFRVGVIVDHTPLVPKVFSGDVKFSLVGSSGGMCVANAGREEVPDQMIPSMGAAMR